MTRLDPVRLARVEAMEGFHFWSIGRDSLTTWLIDRHEAVGPVLEAGAGTGAFAAALTDRGHEVHRFDLGPLVAPGFRASVTAMPVADRSVGVVLARDVIEHVDDRLAVAEMARVLRRGGRGVLTVPAWPSLWSARDDLAGHRRRYRRSDLVELFADAELEVIDIRGYQMLTLPLFVASRLWSRMRGVEVDDVEERIPGWLNRVLLMVTRIELWAGKVVAPPTGSSLVVVVGRP